MLQNLKSRFYAGLAVAMLAVLAVSASAQDKEPIKIGSLSCALAETASTASTATANPA